MHIRVIEKHDLADCLTLLQQLTSAGPFENSEEIFQQISGIVYVVEIEHKIVGMATVLIEQKLIHQGGKVAHIEDVVVDQDHRKLGIGKQLINHCVEVAKQEKCYKIILDCDEAKSGFYKKAGFKTYGICMKIVL